MRARYAPQLPPYGGVLDDLYVYDPAAGSGPAGAWLDPAAAGGGGPPTPARAGQSLVAAGGKIYSFGGYTDWPGRRGGRS